MNFKDKLAHVPLPSGSHYFPLIEHLSSVKQDFPGNDLCLTDLKSIYTPNNEDEAKLIYQACNLKDLQESYYNQMTIEVQESCRIEVDNKLNEASNWLDAESICYNALKAKLEQVESMCKKLLKKFQSLDDQKKDLTSEDLLEEAEREIDTPNAIKVTDLAIKVILEKIEAFVKDSFEDLKTF
ncbi:hypothetical protein Cgig2_015068 [Carnegiea gigantea]|uniref:Uncharacterized protein n=1 Tax=Carnegiea gigantea TaxID=171969 RepID=A0A9Q1QCR3_9CARY|nr:hypothetical protein Cgig2_015068 [Carnegiea gigantea]